MTTSKPPLFIIGLRRSGTTIFWKWFRQDPTFTCFDEPFSEQLLRLPADHEKEIWSEYQKIFDLSPTHFWDVYSPIHRADELTSSFTTEQRAYLTYLAGCGDRVVFDLTRCHLKLAELADLCPGSAVMQLLRVRRSFATSHLVPSRTDPVGRARAKVLERTFFTRHDKYDFWGMESLVGSSPASRFGRLLDREGFDAAAIYELPAVGRLMALWELHRHIVERDGHASFGDSFATVSFEEFASSPEATTVEACRRLGVAPPETAAPPSVRPATPPYKPEHSAWAEICAMVDAAVPSGRGA